MGPYLWISDLPDEVVDPGFPRGGGTNHKGGGPNLLVCPIFPQKLIENLKSLDP